VRHLGIEVDDVLAIAEQVGVAKQTNPSFARLRFPPKLRKPTSGLYEYIP
jgi:hypothetical protein